MSIHVLLSDLPRFYITEMDLVIIADRQARRNNKWGLLGNSDKFGQNREFYTAFGKKYLHCTLDCDTIFQHSARCVDFLSVPGAQNGRVGRGMKPPEDQLN